MFRYFVIVRKNQDIKNDKNKIYMHSSVSTASLQSNQHLQLISYKVIRKKNMPKAVTRRKNVLGVVIKKKKVLETSYGPDSV